MAKKPRQSKEQRAQQAIVILAALIESRRAGFANVSEVARRLEISETNVWKVAISDEARKVGIEITKRPGRRTAELEAKVIEYLLENQTATANDAAKALKVSRPTVSRIVRDAIASGRASRTDINLDARAIESRRSQLTGKRYKTPQTKPRP